MLSSAIQFFCIIHFSSSWTAASSPNTESQEERLRTNLVQNGRLLETWSTNYSEFTEDINLSNLGIEVLQDSTFAKFTTLNKLDLSSNKLTSRKDLVHALRHIRPLILNISYNDLGSFDAKDTETEYEYDPSGLGKGKIFSFDSTYFWSVDLSHNSFVTIDIRFDAVHLNLSNNLMQCHGVQSNDVYDGMPRYVSNLDLSHNSIDCQDAIFSRDIHILDMSYNQLKGIDKNGLLSGLRRLAELNLSHNNIRYIHPRAFEDTVSLQHLDLQYNQIRNIYKQVWSPLSFIRFIDLSSNRLEYLDWVDKYSLYRTKNVITAVNVQNNSNVRCSPGSQINFRFCRGWIYSSNHVISGCRDY